MAAFFGILAFVLACVAILAGTFYLQLRGELKAAHQKQADFEQKATSALARYKGIADLEKHKEELQTHINKSRAILPKFQSLAEMEQHRFELSATLNELKEADALWRQHLDAQETQLNRLKAETEAVEEALDMQSFGFYRPKYDFEDSSRYSQQLDMTRDRQKALVKSDGATHCPQQWRVDGSAAKGRKMVNEQAKLMLRAFNGECDAAIAKVRYNNVNNLESRINRSVEAINKLGASKSLWITPEYLKLKLQELYLVHEHRERVEEEREEQRRIKEQMREEEKVVREIEKAKQDAERDEASKSKALEKARSELAESHGIQTDRLKGIVDRLEAELKDALERKAKAIARAQLTRSGHVYILSNIGSFGDGVFKIGMTRRLEPLERVDELGDASVPFRFDVHAMIYSEDAPALENLLHKHFESRRVNMVNLRREFFRVTLDEIREAVEQYFGTITFVTVPQAPEYRQTVAIHRESMSITGKITA